MADFEVMCETRSTKRKRWMWRIWGDISSFFSHVDCGEIVNLLTRVKMAELKLFL